MEDKEKAYVKLKLGLTIKKIIDERKVIGKENKDLTLKYKRFIDSYVKLATYSGISKTIIIQIAKGRKNAASTTIVAIIDALEMTLSSFGKCYDAISEQELEEYKKELIIDARNKARERKKKAKR